MLNMNHKESMVCLNLILRQLFLPTAAFLITIVEENLLLVPLGSAGHRFLHSDAIEIIKMCICAQLTVYHNLGHLLS